MQYTLITGASKGIGKAFAHQCAARGMNLLLVARSQQLLTELATELMAKGVTVHTHTCDLLDHAAHKKIFDWVRANNYSINMLINNAGMGFYGKFDQQPLEKHVEVMHLNMDAMVKLTHEFLNNSDKNTQRYILNSVSMAAYLPVPYMSIYAASKAFMLSFAYALRYELRNDKVNITSLCPGGVETDFFGPAQMEKVAAKTAKLMMTAEVVAQQGLDGLLANKAEVVPGFTNKLGAFVSRHAPRGFVAAQAGILYRPE